MSGYASRSLYDSEEEEATSSLPATIHVGEVFNDSTTREIIVVIYGIEDTLQVAHVEKKKIPPASSCVFNYLHCSEHPLTEYHLHVHFPGLMGLISPRTQQSAGYGFKVQAGENYHVSLLPKKDIKVFFCAIWHACRFINNLSCHQGNKCALFRANSVGPEADVPSTVYKFGDILLKPTIRLAKRVFNVSNINLRPTLYTEYRDRRRTQIEDQPSLGTRSGTDLSIGVNSIGNSDLPAEAIDELEVWGLFFDDICTVGVRMCQNSFQKVDVARDQEKEEKEEEEEAWISVDDVELQEPFLFIGLPACALFMTIFRSFADPKGIILMDTRRVVKETCPGTFKEMFEMLMETKRSLMELDAHGGDSQLQHRDILWMQQFLLLSSSSQEITLSDCPSQERQTNLRHALSHLVGVSMQLTQQPFFKENFMNVLEEIARRVSA